MSETASPLTASRLVEQGDPAADARAFRRCLGQYPTGVTVITTRHGDRLAGMAVNSFAAVSLEPPLVLWSIRRESASAPVFLEASHFAVNVLSADQVKVSQLFGASQPDRFSHVAWSPGSRGVPLLDGALVHFECKREIVYEGGDHLILVGRVERYTRFECEPLVFAQGQYAVARNHPWLAATATSNSGPVAERNSPSFLRLLSMASQRMSALFQEHRHALDVTAGSARILSRLSEGACGIEELEGATYLGEDAIEDALDDLIALGDVLRNTQALFELTPKGNEKRQALARRSADFTAEKLEGLPASDIAIATRVLMALQQQ
ncbi:flavin reductase [Paraburkholderia xenovorans]